jgi:hypothetical protein
MQRMKVTIAIIAGFILGFLAHWALAGRSGVKHHWKVVEQWNAYVGDPAHYKPDPATELSVTTPPASPEPSLAALVRAGELEHVDLVLPHVPCSRETERQWLAFAQSHKEIVYITGNPSYAIQPPGEQPLHLNIWFKAADQPVVQSLIRELEEPTRGASQQNGAAKESQPIGAETNQMSEGASARR